MRLAVFGASGRTGSVLVREALRMGYEVRALVREESTDALSSHPALTVISGEVTDIDDVLQAVETCDAALVCLGLNRTSSCPWSRYTSSKQLLSEAALNIVGALEIRGIKRVMYLSMAGAGNSWLNICWFFRAIVKRSSIEDEIQEHTQAEAILRASSLSWTIVRPVHVADSAKALRLTPIEGSISLLQRVPRSSVAVWMLRHLHDPKMMYRALTLGKSRCACDSMVSSGQTPGSDARKDLQAKAERMALAISP